MIFNFSSEMWVRVSVAAAGMDRIVAGAPDDAVDFAGADEVVVNDEVAIVVKEAVADDFHDLKTFQKLGAAVHRSNGAKHGGVVVVIGEPMPENRVLTLSFYVPPFIWRRPHPSIPSTEQILTE
jgi:hypothetical protein